MFNINFEVPECWECDSTKGSEKCDLGPTNTKEKCYGESVCIAEGTLKKTPGMSYCSAQ